MAHHFEFMGQDEDFQFGVSTSLPENYISAVWALGEGGDELQWKTATSAPSSVKNEIRTAIRNWETAIPELGWADEPTTDDDWDVEFLYKNCDHGLASYIVRNWMDFGNRQARYWVKAEICVNSTVQWSGNGRLSAIAHEIGHAYGLHEGYIEQRGRAPICNNATMTIMDAGTSARHCDGLTGPASYDTGQVHKIFREGEFLNFTATADADDEVVDFKWKDGAWGEIHHAQRYFHLLREEGQWNWVEFRRENVVPDTGTHVDMPFPDPDAEVKGRIYRQSSWPYIYIACGHPYFDQFEEYGTWRCSNWAWANEWIADSD